MPIASRLGYLALLAAAALGAAAWAAPAARSSSQSSQKGIAYRWVDEQGVVHYGDNIPPQYASQDRAILNSQGVEVGHLDAQKTPAEEAVAARARMIGELTRDAARRLGCDPRHARDRFGREIAREPADLVHAVRERREASEPHAVLGE